jgi:hypothetical protein
MHIVKTNGNIRKFAKKVSEKALDNYIFFHQKLIIIEIFENVLEYTE